MKEKMKNFEVGSETENTRGKTKRAPVWWIMFLHLYVYDCVCLCSSRTCPLPVSCERGAVCGLMCLRRTRPHQSAIIRILWNGYCLTSTLAIIVRTIKRKMNPRFRGEMADFRDAIPVSAIKWKLPFTYSSGLINYSLACATAEGQWKMRNKLRCIFCPVSVKPV